MDNLMDDLDKVLDDFEMNEDLSASGIPGQESKPSGIQEFLKASGDADNPYAPVLATEIPVSTVENLGVRCQESAPPIAMMYDIPYEPLDLSGADFAPSPPRSPCNPAAGELHTTNGSNNIINRTITNSVVESNESPFTTSSNYMMYGHYSPLPLTGDEIDGQPHTLASASNVRISQDSGIDSQSSEEIIQSNLSQTTTVSGGVTAYQPGTQSYIVGHSQACDTPNNTCGGDAFSQNVLKDTTVVPSTVRTSEALCPTLPVEQAQEPSVACGGTSQGLDSKESEPINVTNLNPRDDGTPSSLHHEKVDNVTSVQPAKVQDKGQGEPVESLSEPSIEGASPDAEAKEIVSSDKSEDPSVTIPEGAEASMGGQVDNLVQEVLDELIVGAQSAVVLEQVPVMENNVIKSEGNLCRTDQTLDEANHGTAEASKVKPDNSTDDTQHQCGDEEKVHEEKSNESDARDSFVVTGCCVAAGVLDGAENEAITADDECQKVVSEEPNRSSLKPIESTITTESKTASGEVVIGFSEVTDTEVDMDEMESYLAQTEAEVKELKMEFDEDNCEPQVNMKELESLVSEIEISSKGQDIPSSSMPDGSSLAVSTSVSSTADSGFVETMCEQVENLDSDIEHILNRNVTNRIATPMEEPGVSKLPGFSVLSQMSPLVEEKELAEEEEEKCKGVVGPKENGPIPSAPSTVDTSFQNTCTVEPVSLTLSTALNGDAHLPKKINASPPPKPPMSLDLGLPQPMSMQRSSEIKRPKDLGIVSPMMMSPLTAQQNSDSVPSPSQPQFMPVSNSAEEKSDTVDCSPPKPMQNTGARPKEPSQLKKNRPNSLLGLSKPSLPIDPKNLSDQQVQPLVGPPEPSVNGVNPDNTTSAALQGLTLVNNAMTMACETMNDSPVENLHDAINRKLALQNKNALSKKITNLEIKQQMENEQRQHSNLSHDNRLLELGTSSGQPDAGAEQGEVTDTLEVPGEEQQQQQGSLHPEPQESPSMQPKQKRPTSLQLPPRGDFSASQNQRSPVQEDADQDSLQSSLSSLDIQPPTQQPAAEAGAGGEMSPPFEGLDPTQSSIGRLAPVWVPDSEAPNCSDCEHKFTFTKRRHHCRGCGNVFCNSCCNMRCKLQYMDNKEARVCKNCYQEIQKEFDVDPEFSTWSDYDVDAAQAFMRMNTPNRSPNPNNPSEYCSTIPPLQQAQAALNAPPPTVMVPVGVLKREGSKRQGEPKQVMFSDGIRPGGDLTELDGAESRLPIRKQGRVQKKVEKSPDPPSTPETPQSSSPKTKRKLKTIEGSRNVCLIPEDGLPPVILATGVKGDYSIEENPDSEQILPQIKDTDAEPVVFAVNKNLFVMVKIINLDCCVNRVCWCYTTKGLCTVGQAEMVIVLECLPDEKVIPRDIFSHFQSVYEEAGKGKHTATNMLFHGGPGLKQSNTVSNLGHTIFSQSFLESRDHGGFLYIQPTFQCLQKLLLPNPPYLFGILLQKWETPWAKVFPLRLMLRLGAEFKYYPCPLISVRFRKPVYEEIGHTIMNLLADFRNYQYMLPQIKGVVVHMEDKKTYINFPKNRYNDVMKVINYSNDHVMAFGANFSLEADSHLVCIQNDEGNYQTQAINIQNKPRKVTGSSFVVFNGALKSSSGLMAKSSIVEDGLMVQITAESMVNLKQTLRDMKDYTIGCGLLEAPKPEEVVVVQWSDDDKHVNMGVKSPIDNMSMDGIESIHIHNSTDYVGESRTIRWTEVFFIQNEDVNNSRCEPVDLSRLAETLASACCIALTPHLDKLKKANLTKIGLRATIDTDKVGYEIGAGNDKLPGHYMNDLDNELIPVIHNAASHSQEGPVTLELVFHILE